MSEIGNREQKQEYLVVFLALAISTDEIRPFHKFAPSVRPPAAFFGDFERNGDITIVTVRTSSLFL
jgi:hypothetical protein